MIFPGASYDRWKTTNPADEYLGPDPNDEEPESGYGPCPHCFESSGYAARWNPHTWDEPGWCDADPMRPCSECEGTGRVRMEDATDSELFEYFDEALDALCEEA